MRQSRFAITALLACSAFSVMAESTIPKVIGMPYDQARAAVIRAGWVPATNLKLEVGDAYAEDFRITNGYTEVQSCSSGGLLKCGFVYTDSTSPSRLRLVAGGEGMPTVDDVQVQRPQKPGSVKSPASVKAPTEPEKPRADVIGNSFAKLPENTRNMGKVMQDAFAKYLAFIVKNEPDDTQDAIMGAFCTQKVTDINQMRKEMDLLLVTSGSAALNEFNRDAVSLETNQQKEMIAKGDQKGSLLVDVNVSTRMFAGYSRLSGENLKDYVRGVCRSAKEIAASETSATESSASLSQGK